MTLLARATNFRGFYNSTSGLDKDSKNLSERDIYIEWDIQRRVTSVRITFNSVANDDISY